MTRKDYNNTVLLRIEKSFDTVIPIAGIISIISAIAIYFSSIPLNFVFLDGTIGLLLLIMSIFRKHLHAELKIVFTIGFAMIIGVFSFMDGGFVSSAITLFLISNVISVLFLNRKTSYVITAVSIALFIGLWIWATTVYDGNTINYGTEIWIIQLLTFVLYLVMMHTMVYTIRKYLLESIADLEDSMAQIYQLAYYDQLTGLPNQYLFKEILLKRINEEKVTGFLVFFNLRNLNLINSLYGESLGDAVLTGTTQIFKEIKVDNEVLSRVSGNEFALWIQNPVDFKERLHYYESEFFKRFHVPEMTKKVEFYISYIEYNYNISFMDCYQNGAIALTYAKTHDIQTPVHYDHNLDEAITNEETMKEELIKALIEDQFELYYQEKVDTMTQEVVSVEALARWNNDVLGQVSPVKFIPVLEKINSSADFGNLILRKAFHEYTELCKKYNKEIKLSINISPSHLSSKGFIYNLKDAINKYKIRPSVVILEITEEIVIEGVDFVTSLIDEIKLMGIRVSLDDFGSGYSSLNYLTKLNIDELKIDKSFVDEVLTDKKVEIMLVHLVELAYQYKLNVVAEGVETEEQYNKIKEIGCHEIQGYYFSKPQPL